MQTSTSGAARHGGRATLLGAVLLACSISWAGSFAQAAFLSPGDIVVAEARSPDFSAGRIYRVDPVTGDRSVLSAGGIRGDGPAIWGPVSIAQEGASLLVLDYGSARVVRIDPETGDRTVVSSHPYLPDETEFVGDGPEFVDPLEEQSGAIQLGSIAVSSAGQIVVAAQRGLFHVDGSSGDRSLVSGPSLGAGPMFDKALINLREAADGTWYVSDSYNGAILRIDPITGDRQVVADSNTGSGVSIHDTFGLVIDTDGSLLTTLVSYEGGEHSVGIYRVDPLTGDRTLVPGSEGAGGAMMDRLLSGKLVLSSFGSVLHLFDPATGEYSILSGGGVGSGPELFFTTAVLVYVPEPSSLTMAGLGVALVGLCAVRRRFTSKVH